MGQTSDAERHTVTFLPPPPPAATTLIDRLSAGGFASMADVVAAGGDLVSRPAEFTPVRRAMTVALSGVAPVIFAAMGLLAAFGMRELAATAPDVEPLVVALQRLAPPDPQTTPIDAREREALEMYVAGRYRQTIANESTWTHPLNAARLAPYRAQAVDILRRHPDATPASADAVKGSLGTFLELEQKSLRTQRERADRAVGIAPLALGMIGLLVASAGGVLFALVLRGGLFLRVFGLAVVDARGRRVPRWQTMLRAVLAWAPGAALGLIALQVPGIMNVATATRTPGWLALGLFSGAVFLGGAAFAIARPTRGWQDQIARTFLVPE
jgi:hypothetical protein